MKVAVDIKTLSVAVQLSRRNLMDLIAALDLVAVGQRNTATLARHQENGVFITVTAQEDPQHYEGRTAGPGITYGSFKRL